MRKDVRKKLIDVAKKGKTITYGELMKRFHIPRGHLKPGIGIGHVVGIISEYEHRKKRPFLSAIVVAKGSASNVCQYGRPSGGFFFIYNLPAVLRRDESKRGVRALTNPELKFVRKEQKKVWNYWQSHRDDEL